MRLAPAKQRFNLALSTARLCIPLVRWTGAYAEQRKMGFHSPREITVFLLLNALTKHGTSFDPPFIVDGYEHVERARSRHHGILVTGHHAALTVLLVRYFSDQGLRPVVLTPDERFRIPGTREAARIVRPSDYFLVQLRSRLRDGELICAMPDRAEHHGTRTTEFTTVRGRVIIAPAIIEVASRSGAKVLFTEVRLDGRQLRAKIVAPSPRAETGMDLTHEFIAFVRSCMSRPGIPPETDRVTFQKASPARLFSRG